MKKYFFIVLLSCLACQHIETGNTLDKDTIQLIRSLGLLEPGETIIQYYSNAGKDKAGNFFTDRRIAHYWLASRDPAENDTSFAWYRDITSIDTVYNMQGELSYMGVNYISGHSFRVSVDGSKKEIRRFFETAMLTWQQHRK